MHCGGCGEVQRNISIRKKLKRKSRKAVCHRVCYEFRRWVHAAHLFCYVKEKGKSPSTVIREAKGLEGEKNLFEKYCSL